MTSERELYGVEIEGQGIVYGPVSDIEYARQFARERQGMLIALQYVLSDTELIEDFRAAGTAIDAADLDDEEEEEDCKP